MYGLKNTVDLSFFLRAAVTQICVSNSALIINFDKSVRLTILSTFSVSPTNGVSNRLDSYAASASALFPLIGETIAAVRATESGGLRMEFQSGIYLDVFDDSEQFESFWIADGENLIIV
jgi:hypothetical protein